jgi:hypothetical protein
MMREAKLTNQPASQRYYGNQISCETWHIAKILMKSILAIKVKCINKHTENQNTRRHHYGFKYKKIMQV